MRSLAVLVLSLSLLAGCFTPEEMARMEERERLETLHKAKVFTVEDIINAVYRGTMAWAEGRSVLEAKGFTWEEAETLLETYLPEEYRWGGKP